VTLRALPTFCIPPDWSQTVTESLEWQTNIMASPVGAEQRQLMRISPRRSIEYTAACFDSYYRGFLTSLMDAGAGQEFYVPLWVDINTLDRSAPAGATVLTFAGQRNELLNATAIFIAGDTPWNSQGLEVASTSFSGGFTYVNLVSGLAVRAGKGTTVYRLMSAYLEISSVTETRQSDSAVSAQVRFTFTQNSDWPVAEGFEVYQSAAVVEWTQSEADTMEGTYDRLQETLDNQTGIPVTIDIAGLAFPTNKFTVSLFNKAQIDSMRSYLYLLSGRLLLAYFPTGRADFVVTEDLVANTNALTVARCGFTEFGGVSSGRQDILVTLRNGVKFYERIIGSALIGNTNEESLTVADAWPYSIRASDILRVSFLQLGRLDADRIDIVYSTDSVAQVSLVVKRVPDLRVAPDWG
jgi:hypothetical protein